MRAQQDTSAAVAVGSGFGGGGGNHSCVSWNHVMRCGMFALQFWSRFQNPYTSITLISVYSIILQNPWKIKKHTFAAYCFQNK